MDPERFVARLYDAFNARDADAALAHAAGDVDWPNAWEGGREQGRDAVRAYWARQWAATDPHVDPLAVEVRDDGRLDVLVRGTVRDLDGALLDEHTVRHVYTLRAGLVARMDIEPAGDQKA